MFGLERSGLEFDDYITFQPGVIEKEVNKKLISLNFEPELTADKGKTCTQLQEETGDVANEGVFDVAFVRFIAKTEKVEMVGIFEDLGGMVGLSRRKGGVQSW